MAFLHSNRAVHLDLKPGNVLLVKKGGSHLKLCDFGLTRRMGKHVDGADHKGRDQPSSDGTPLYMPPERLCKSSVMADTSKAQHHARTRTFFIQEQAVGRAASSQPEDTETLFLSLCKADVYAFWILLAAMVRKNDIYVAEIKQLERDAPESDPMPALCKQICCGLPPALPAETPEPLMDIIRACWHQEANKRPNIITVRTRLAALAAG
jgi:serine/threonine protein kinase